jgi:hypothetical protein
MITLFTIIVITIVKFIKKIILSQSSSHRNGNEMGIKISSLWG